MKQFLKITLATLCALIIFGILSSVMFFSCVASLSTLSESPVVMPKTAVLKIDMSKIMLSEQTKEADPMSYLQTGTQAPAPLGIWSAISAINAAAADPAVKFIYLLPDGLQGGLAQIEELRTALAKFRESGKAVIAYTENPSNGGYYLASVADKIYMTSHEGGMSMLTGISGRLIFLKDILDKLGVNVQLIRHGKYKSAGEMYVRSSASPENMAQNEAMINSIWKTYSGKMAEARGMEAAKFNALIDNLTLNAPSDFLENGLVDALMTREELQQKIADLFLADNYKNVGFISLPDYASLKKTLNIKATNKVAVIYAEGSIVDGSQMEEVAGDRFAKIIADVRNDQTVKAVVLRVDSPGGSVLASDKIKAELDLLKEEKTVIASYGDYAASGGYWISNNCDRIFSNATTLTGSIGVFSMIPDVSKTVKNTLHINITPVNSNEHSDMYNMMRPLSPKEVEYMQASVESIYTKFTGIVAQGRNMSVADVDAIAQGRVWTGADALGIGLVDQIGTIEDAINYAAMSIEDVDSLADVNIVEYPKPLTTWELLLNSLNGTDPEARLVKGTFLEGAYNEFRNWNADCAGQVFARMPYDIVIR